MSDVQRHVEVEWTSEYPIYSTDAVQATCLVSLVAPRVDFEKPEERRAPVSLTVVIDKSGSMTGQKLELVKDSVSFVLKQLNERDNVAVVSYDSDVRPTFKRA